MTVGMLLDAPEGSQEAYDALTEKMFGSLQPTAPPEGLILHTAGPLLDGGWRIFDVWESEDAFWRFFDAVLLPAARDLDQSEFQARPEFFPVHNMISTSS
jgi:hypothetical protein